VWLDPVAASARLRDTTWSCRLTLEPLTEMQRRMPAAIRAGLTNGCDP
jgi:hypothetical protein